MRRTSPRFLRYLLAGVLAVASITVPLSANAYTQLGDDGPTSGDMLADVVFIRPFSLVSTVASTAAFIVSLPLSLIGGNVGDAAETLVAEPFMYTFARPIGVYDERVIDE